MPLKYIKLENQNIYPYGAIISVDTETKQAVQVHIFSVLQGTVITKKKTMMDLENLGNQIFKIPKYAFIEQKECKLSYPIDMPTTEGDTLELITNLLDIIIYDISTKCPSVKAIFTGGDFFSISIEGHFPLEDHSCYEEGDLSSLFAVYMPPLERSNLLIPMIPNLLIPMEAGPQDVDEVEAGGVVASGEDLLT